MRKALLLAAIIAAFPATSSPVVAFRAVTIRPSVAPRIVQPKTATSTNPTSVSKFATPRSVGQPVNRVRSEMFVFPSFKPSDFCSEKPRRIKDWEFK